MPASLLQLTAASLLIGQIDGLAVAAPEQPTLLFYNSKMCTDAAPGLCQKLGTSLPGCSYGTCCKSGDHYAKITKKDSSYEISGGDAECKCHLKAATNHAE